jgi:hypothetical protein
MVFVFAPCGVDGEEEKMVLGNSFEVEGSVE